MEGIKIRKDTKGNIISKGNKDYHITICENFVTIIEVPSFKQYNILNDDNDYDEDENKESPFVDTYVEKDKEILKKEKGGGGQGFSRAKCIIL